MRAAGLFPAQNLHPEYLAETQDLKDGKITPLATRWPRRVQVGTLKKGGEQAMCWRSLTYVMSADYWTHVAANTSAMVSRIALDIDDPSKLDRWKAMGFPMPSFVLKNRANDKAHLIWELKVPVHRANSPKSWRLMRSVRERMQHFLGGDPNYTGGVMKSPWSKSVQIYLPATPSLYSLTELSEALPFHHQPGTRSGWTRPALAPDAGSRNCALFERVRTWAYGQFAAYAAAGDKAGFLREVEAKSHEWNSYTRADVGPRGKTGNLSRREVGTVARSIGQWVWRVFSARANTSAIENGRAGGLAKGRAYEERAVQARQLRAEGVSVPQIAAQLDLARSTVYKYLAAPADTEQPTPADVPAGVHIAISVIPPVGGPPALAAALGPVVLRLVAASPASCLPSPSGNPSRQIPCLRVIDGGGGSGVLRPPPPVSI